MEPTNNRAERGLRPAVIARKVSQCSKTPGGALAHAVFVSIICSLGIRGDPAAVDALAGVSRTGRVPKRK